MRRRNQSTLNGFARYLNKLSSNSGTIKKHHQGKLKLVLVLGSDFLSISVKTVKFKDAKLS